METNERLTDAQLIELVQETAPEDLSLAQIEQLRSGLRESADLRAVLIDQLHMESYLNNALSEIQVSVETILLRAAGQRRGLGWPLRIGLALGLLLIGGAVYFGVMRQDTLPHDDPTLPIASTNSGDARPTDEGADGADDPVNKDDAPRPAPPEQAPWSMVREAEQFDRSNVQVDRDRFGKEIGVLVSPAQGVAFAEYDVEVPTAGVYQLEVRYASDAQRPLQLTINGQSISTPVADAATGSGEPSAQHAAVAGQFPLTAGRNTLRLERDGEFPHLDKLALVAMPGKSTAQTTNLSQLPVVALASSAPAATPPMPMPTAQPPTRSLPWRDTLNPAKPPRAVQDVAFRPLGGEAIDDLPPQELQDWVEAVPGQPHRIHERQFRRGRYSAVEGISRLRAPWPRDAVLRLGLFDPNQIKIHLWTGTTGISLHWLQHAQPQMWVAYQSTRDVETTPVPKTLALAATDDGRHVRSEFGVFELRWQDGLLLMTRDDVVLLAAPLAAPPTEMIFEGTTWLSELAMYRAEPFPVNEPEQRPAVLLAQQPAGLLWETEVTAGPEILRRSFGSNLSLGAVWDAELAPGVRLTGGPEGTIELATGPPDPGRTDPVATRTWLAEPGLHEIIVQVDDATPGTGLFLAGDDGQPLYHISFVRDQRTGATVVVPIPAKQFPLETNIDPVHAPASYFAPGHWLRIVVGFGTLKLWTSADGVHWGRATRDPIRNVPRLYTSLGLYVVQGGEPRHLRLRHVEIREMSAVTTLATHELRNRVPDLGPLATMAYDAWLVRVVATRPQDVPLDDWRRACAVRELERQPWSPQLADLLQRLIGDALSESVPVAQRFRVLDELALLQDLWGNNQAPAFAQHYERLGRSLAREGVADAFGRVARALHTAPIWWEGKTLPFSFELGTDLIVRSLFAGDWLETAAIYRRVRSWMQSAHPEQGWEFQDQYRTRIFDWAVATAAPHLPAAARDGVPVLTHRWRHPLISQLSKEGYNVMAEFEAALASRAYEDACQIIAAAGSAGLLGLLPDAKEPDLLVSLPRAVALAMRDHPGLQQTMQTRFGQIAQLRVRQAIAEAAPEAVEAATVQFYGTSAAAEAHRWLGDRSLAAGKFSQAAGHYRDALPTADGALAHDLDTRLKLAQSMLGVPAGKEGGVSVELGGVRFSPAEFQALLTEFRESPTRRATGAVATTDVALSTAPPPTAYEVRPLGGFNGDLGNNVGNGATHDTDWAARQLSIAADADTLYANNRFQITAYDLATGQQRWSQALGGEHGEAHDWRFIAMRPLIAGDRLYARRLTANGPELVCLNKADGAVRWRKRPEGHVASDPLFLHDKLVALVATFPQAGIVQLDLATFHTETGDLLSQRTLLRLNDAWNQRVPCEVVASGGRLICVIGGTVACCDAAGRPEWLRQQVWFPDELDRENYLQYRQRPIIDRGRLYVTQPGVKAVACLELETGRQYWSRPVTDIRRVMAVAGQRVVVQTGGGLQGFDAETGKLVWREDIADRILDGTLVGNDGTFVYTRQLNMGPEAFQPALIWIDPVTGRETAHAPLAAFQGKTPLLGPLASNSGKLWAFFGGDWKQGHRDLVELVPRDVPPAGAVDSTSLGHWQPNQSGRSASNTAVALPGWTLLSSQPTIGPQQAADLRPEVRGEQQVLVTKNGEQRPIHFLRRLTVPGDGQPRLALRVGLDAGQPWQLSVNVDGAPAYRAAIDDASTQNGWTTTEIDLKPYAGRTVWITVTQATDDPAKAVDAFWKRMEFLQ